MVRPGVERLQRWVAAAREQAHVTTALRLAPLLSLERRGEPLAVIPLVALTANRQIMGAHTTHPATTLAGAGIAATLVALNTVLLAQTI